MTEQASSSSLFTDLYELTMAAAYREEGMDGLATFELFVRSLPAERRFLVVAGLEEVLGYLESFRFGADDLSYLATVGAWPDGFLDDLATWRFDGDVWAMPEGEVAYAGEPLMRVTARLPVAQLVETYLLNTVASHTLMASKAARVALACGGRDFVDFSARRDHGTDAAVQVARAAWIGGAAGTSLVVAGRQFGLPLSGTMAHSFVMAHDDEREAFRRYARTFPEGTVLLIDTYDTVDGARNAADVAHELAPEGITIRGVRLDSGDLGTPAAEVRAVLDGSNLHDVRIIASGDLDEHRIAALLAAGAPIDAFGVGTQLGTSADAPALGAVYKLVEDVNGPKLKLATGKQTLPGRKQVWRLSDRDVLALEHEVLEGGRPLLSQVMASGQRVGPPEDLDVARDRCRAGLAELAGTERNLEPRPESDSGRQVTVAPGLSALRDRLVASRRDRALHG